MSSYNWPLAKTLFGGYVIWLMLHLLTNIKEVGATLDYAGWGLSDMLINYQAGFVRRGLLGEMMHRIYDIIPFNVGYSYLVIIFATAISCCFTLLIICRRLSYSPVLVFSGFTLQFLALAEVFGIRRDYLMLLLCLLAFWTYRKWINAAKCAIFWLSLCQSIMIIAVLLHEGTWFYMAPLLCLHLFQWNRVHLHQTWTICLVRSLAFISPVAIIMVSLYLHKGNIAIAQSIWQSWQPLFCQYPLQGTQTPSLGLSVSSLASSTMDFVNGCGMSRWGLTYWGWFPMFPLTITLFPILIYLVSCANFSGISMGYPLRTINKTLLTTIMLVQLISMSPFFLFLSCDYGRLFCYWIVSTIFAYYIFVQDLDYFPEFVNHLSKRFHDTIAKIPFLCTPLGYVLILVLTPCNMVGGAALGAIPLYRMLHEIPELLRSLF